MTRSITEMNFLDKHECKIWIKCKKYKYFLNLVIFETTMKIWNKIIIFLLIIYHMTMMMIRSFFDLVNVSN